MRNRIFILVMVMAQAVAVHAQMPPWLPAHTDVATAELVTVFGNFEIMVHLYIIEQQKQMQEMQKRLLGLESKKGGE